MPPGYLGCSIPRPGSNGGANGASAYGSAHKHSVAEQAGLPDKFVGHVPLNATFLKLQFAGSFCRPEELSEQAERDCLKKGRKCQHSTHAMHVTSVALVLKAVAHNLLKLHKYKGRHDIC